MLELRRKTEKRKEKINKNKKKEPGKDQPDS